MKVLDHWCPQHGVNRVDIIKMDVDGNEFPILAGARDIIERYKPMLLLEAVAIHFDNDSKNPYQLLAGIGYRIWDLSTGLETSVSAIGKRLPVDDHEMTISLNILASADPASF